MVTMYTLFLGIDCGVALGMMAAIVLFMQRAAKRPTTARLPFGARQHVPVLHA